MILDTAEGLDRGPRWAPLAEVAERADQGLAETLDDLERLRAAGVVHARDSLPVLWSLAPDWRRVYARAYRGRK